MRVPATPAVRVPTKEAMLMPRGPGVISAMEIMSVYSQSVSQ